MPDCTHHWLLDNPKDRIVHGVCMFCNAEKDWPHVIYGRYGDTPAILRDPLPSWTHVGQFESTRF